jgi:hypothetical protein
VHFSAHEELDSNIHRLPPRARFRVCAR